MGFFSHYVATIKLSVDSHPNMLYGWYVSISNRLSMKKVYHTFLHCPLIFRPIIRNAIQECETQKQIEAHGSTKGSNGGISGMAVNYTP